MRFLVIVKASEESESGVMPSEAELTAMGKFNEELVEAGIMVAGEGLHASSDGARIVFTDDGHTVVPGPFPNPQELIAGYWVIRANSQQEAIDWLSKAPFDKGATLEVRRIFEAEDFGEALTPELQAQEERLRTQVAEQQK